jgi:hypothetical protein
MTTTIELMQNELLSNDFTKKLTVGVAGAALLSAAFFIGYQAAKRRHAKRLFYRDADKNELVRRRNFII